MAVKKAKKVEVSSIVEWANLILSNQNSQGYWDTTQYREGIICVVEKILHESNSYNGYTFMNTEVPISIGEWGNVCRKYILK
jgi:hypothetical protein